MTGQLRSFLSSVCPVTKVPRATALIIACFSVLTVLPLTLFDYGGDIMFQYVAIKCFASQFWAGDLYPRWCFSANAGLGSPIFVYYFPLPFYIASLFYPLTWLGLSLPGVYLLSLLAATIVGGLTAWSWLSDLTTPKKALLLALVYLWLPYRMEVMMFRAAYSELWCIAFMPLVCKYTRRLMLGEIDAVPRLALAFALCFLSNMPAATIGVLASGGYTLLMMERRRILWLGGFALALIWGAAMSAFYLVPAILYKPYVTTEGVISGARSWCNDFLTLDNIKNGQGNVVVVMGIMLLCLVGLSVCAVLKRQKITPATWRELRSWVILAAGAYILLIPLSKPLWDHAGFIAMLAFPWRMQLVVMLAAIYMAAVLLDKLVVALRTGDVLMGFFMLALLVLFVISARSPDFVTYGDKIVASQFVTQREYRSVWTDKEYIAMPYILGRYDQLASIPKIQQVSGNAHGAETVWEPGHIELDINAQRPSIVRLDLQYFPMWQMQVQPENAQLLMGPEPGTGQMLVSMSPGRYHLTLSTHIMALSAWKIGFSIVLSILTVALMLCWCRIKKLIV